jgi:hypothetical protein
VQVEDTENNQTIDLPHVKRHSPTGFEWGYSGSGPADLALSILAHHLDMESVGPVLYQAFKAECVAKMGPKWQLHRSEIDNWLNRRWSHMTEDQIRDDLRA